ncbi:MAG: hypothetical protein ACC628_22795, partial [Pirellulaceae bacterium]
GGEGGGRDPGTENRGLSHVVDQGWHDEDFIAKYATGFDAALAANRVSLEDLALATRNVGRRGTGVMRLGDHHEGYSRPPFPGPRPAPHVDQEIINDNGKMLTVWACNAFQTTLNAEQYRETVIHRSNVVQEPLARALG